MNDKLTMDEFRKFLEKDCCKLSNISFRSLNLATLHHYTSIESLKDIMDKNTLWISNVYYLNDSMEIQYAEKLIESVLEESNDIDDYIKEKIRQHINLAKENLNNMYVLSLTDNDDSLTLWSNYSKLEGCNFGIDLYKFEDGIHDGTATIITNMEESVKCIHYPNNTQELNCSVALGQVIYDEVEQLRLVNELVTATNEHFNKYRSTDNPSIENDLIDVTIGFMISYISDILVFFKGPKFSPEEEYRMAFHIMNDIYNEKIIHYRISNGALIPYIKICFNQEVKEKKIPINSVRIGPRNKSDIAIMGFKSYFKSNGFIDLKDKDIKASEIPLRY